MSVSTYCGLFGVSALARQSWLHYGCTSGGLGRESNVRGCLQVTSCDKKKRPRVPNPRPRNSQIIVAQRIVTTKMEAAGIEPAAEFDATTNGVCDCESCQRCRAANALHSECIKSHVLASLDADLQRVIEAWDGIDDTTRRVIVECAREGNSRPSISY